jgi:S-adenosylmethionine decarboxylase
MNGINPSLLADCTRIEQLLRKAAEAAGAHVLHSHFHGFGDGQGVTGVVLLAESHLAVHTWPELQAVTLDVFVCNFGGDNSHKARQLVDTLVPRFEPRHVQRQQLSRGRPS